METHSISLRLQRITVEEAYVQVPVSAEILTEQADGTNRIDGAKLIQRALEIGQIGEVQWYLEDAQVQPHPIQKALEFEGNAPG